MTTFTMHKVPSHAPPLLVAMGQVRYNVRLPSQRHIDRLVAIIKHKDTLLREMGHSIANSLQLVASGLALEARKVRSREARLHLENAHRRVLAIATLRRQIQASHEGGRLDLAAYLRRLCENLAASVSGGANRIAIGVQAESGTVSSQVATSMGLIVTELVINALKHAFADEAAHGRIMVIYSVDDRGWTLTVADNGRGLSPGEAGHGDSGLGTGIVAALVRQIDGHVVTSTGPDGSGTQVSITHRPVDTATGNPGQRANGMVRTVEGHAHGAVGAPDHSIRERPSSP